MSLAVSVVVPVFNGATLIGECVDALMAQSLPRSELELIVVDDGSKDGTAEEAERHGARVIRQENRGAPAARNAGIAAARGTWVAMTDCDCIPSRGWLAALLEAVRRHPDPGRVIGAAGRIVGHQSASPAARFVDLTGGLDAERHLAHPRWPFAPTCNTMFRRAALEAVGGFDPRFAAYDACDLHARLQAGPDRFLFAPRAVVLHRHRASWRAYWRQQAGYGQGMADFMLRYRREAPWTAGREAAAWAAAVGLSLAALRPGSDDAAIMRRGLAVKALAQRVGFAGAFWRPSRRRRWSRASHPATAERHA
jgi:glycosyltransferase involved in cell wall biosynthesis